jgi:hypothetical protein
MQKHRFSATCPTVLCIETTVPPEYEKLCDHVSHPRCTRMHYVTSKSDRIEKHKFDVTCPGTLFIETAPVPPEHEK